MQVLEEAIEVEPCLYWRSVNNDCRANGVTSRRKSPGSKIVADCDEHQSAVPHIAALRPYESDNQPVSLQNLAHQIADTWKVIRGQIDVLSRKTIMTS
jgi:hypothetical protein